MNFPHTRETSDAVSFQGTSESNPAQLLSVFHKTVADLRSGVIVWIFPSGGLKRKVDAPIEADGSSNAPKIIYDWPKILLDPIFLLTKPRRRA